jgi:hypothetical protein
VIPASAAMPGTGDPMDDGPQSKPNSLTFTITARKKGTDTGDT